MNGSHADVTEIGFVQLYGLMPEGPRDAAPVKTFWGSDGDPILNDVIEEVRRAHGDEPVIYCAHEKYITATNDGIPNMKEVEQLVWRITSPGGPTWGMVVVL